jgi:phosphatidate cytidylyltransferase
MEDEHAPAEVDVPSAPRGRLSELTKRLLSGAVFAAIALALAYAGPLPFAALVLVVAVAMSWEWAHVVRGTNVDVTLIIHGLAVTAAIALTAFGFAALGVAVIVIGAIIVLALEFGQRPIFSAAGVLYAGLPAVALLWLRSSEPQGFLSVLFIFVIVAATDTFAYAAGRLIGGPRLAARISPNKTWSGLAGGLLAAALTGVVFAIIVGASPAALALTGLAMGLIAQAGDLGESALKRTFGVKDASNLIPGHGGFMDRVDGIVTVAVAAALAALYVDPYMPAKALLAGL